MKKILLFLAAILTLAACSNNKDGAEITVKMPASGAPNEIIVNFDLISDLAKARQYEDLKTQTDTLQVKDGEVAIPVDSRGPARYIIAVGDNLFAEVYTEPGQSLQLDITSYNPPAYTVKGSALMEDITKLNAITEPLDRRLNELMLSGSITPEQQQQYMIDYDNALTTFVKQNPKSPAVIYAMFQLQGDSFKQTYDNLTPEAKKSILMPIIDDQVARANEVSEEMQAKEQARAEKARGDKDAPNFTFKNIAGKDVSLSDFRGKWVVLDFWGTWCGWCVKGIPSLKEAYKQYAGKLEVIGIDCNEPESDWREGVEHYELPWVNVYNNQTDGQLLKDYSVEGFPTKVIISPEGKIVDITTGEDPSFYDRLAKFING
ncbi:MAG: redoxin domain-containing protein [Muribaculaceae bacterium]|nr:redoxin domain-containing protein [Muribaculaceae bacterium]